MDPFHTYLLVKNHKRKRINRRERKQRSRTVWSLFGIILVILPFITFPLVLGVFYTQISQGLPPVQQFELLLDPQSGLLLQPTVLYDRTGQTEIHRLENTGISRRFLPLDPNNNEFISPYLVQLTVSSLEPDFWNSPGYNTNWLENTDKLTITENLVERMLQSEMKGGWQSGFRRRLLAAQVQRRYGRAQILEWYLNSTNYGHLTIGVDSAAQLYFNKPASELNMAEAALLVAVSQTPALNPLDAPLAAVENQRDLLDQLHQSSAITTEDYQKAVDTELKFNTPQPPANETARAFANMVLAQLYKNYGRERVELGGFNVLTTLDIHLQQNLTCTISARLESSPLSASDQADCPAANLLSSLSQYDPSIIDNMAASGLILNPQNGEVLAFLGDSNGSIENPVIQKHQAGSLLNALVMVNAFSRGFSPASQVWDIPGRVPLSLQEYTQPIDSYRGPIRLRTAVVNDFLAPIIALTQQLGDDLLASSARSFGVELPDSDNPAAFLYGGESASLIEIGTLYSTFATLGIRHGSISQDNGGLAPTWIKKINQNDGHILFEQDIPASQSLVSPQLAYLIHDVLQDDYERRITLGYPNFLEIGRPAGAKYGQVADQKEVWAVGYTPQFTTVIWFGIPADSSGILNEKFAGSTWHALMQWLHSDLPVETWFQPEGIIEVEVCTLSGLLPTRQCPSTVQEVFIESSKPLAYDNLFQTVEINRETGLLATVFTPPEMVEERTYLIVPDDALDWAQAASIPIPPKDYDAIQIPDPSEDVEIIFPAMYAFVRGDIDIRGTAAGIGFNSFRLQTGQGLNPQSWLQVGEEQTNEKSNQVLARWDTTALSDGLYALRLQVIRNDLRIEQHTIQVSVDNSPPVVVALYPAAESVIPLSSQGTITIQAEASDQIGIQRVEFWLDGQNIGIRSQMPYSYPVSISSGNHSLVIKAYDLAGNESTTEEIFFTVQN